MEKAYSKFFSVHEIVENKRLQSFFWLTLFLIVFDMSGASMMVGKDDPMSNRASCWTFFQGCLDSFPFQALPLSYAYGLFMSVFLGLVLLAAVKAAQGRWIRAHQVLLSLMLWKFLFHFVLYNTRDQNFEYFQQIPAFVFLLSRNKLFSCQFSWAFCLLWAAHEKLHPSWISAGYFTNLELGIPLVPLGWEPLATNIVIWFEILCSIGLLSTSKKWVRFSFIGWTCFHLYSVSLVGFYYPVRCLVALWGFFYQFDFKSEVSQYQLRTKSSLLQLLVVAVTALNLFPSLITNDEKWTLEGLGYGFFMFDANHQCHSRVRWSKSDGTSGGTTERSAFESTARCDPYWFLEKIKASCKRRGADWKGHWTFDHSVNGSAFYRVINETNACELSYNFRGGNKWIKTPALGAPIIGYPSPNAVRGVKDSVKTINERPLEKRESFLIQLTEKFTAPMQAFYSILWVVAYAAFVGIAFGILPQRLRSHFGLANAKSSSIESS